MKNLMKYPKTNLIRLLFKPVCAFLLLGSVQDAVANCQNAEGVTCTAASNDKDTRATTNSVDLSAISADDIINTSDGVYVLLKQELDMTLAKPNDANSYNQFNCKTGTIHSAPCTNVKLITHTLPYKVNFGASLEVTTTPVTLTGDKGDTGVKLVLITGGKGQNKGPLIVWEQHNNKDNPQEYKKVELPTGTLQPSLSTQTLLNYRQGATRVCEAGTSGCEQDSTFYFADKLNQTPGYPLYLALYIPRNRSSTIYETNGFPTILKMSHMAYTTTGSRHEYSRDAYVNVWARISIPATCYINSSDASIIDFGTVEPRGVADTETLRNKTLDFATVCKGFKGVIEQKVRVSVADKDTSIGKAGDARATRAFIAKGLNDAEGQGLALIMNYNREYPNNDPELYPKFNSSSYPECNNWNSDALPQFGKWYRFNRPNLTGSNPQGLQFNDKINISLCRYGIIGEYGLREKILRIESRWSTDITHDITD